MQITVGADLRNLTGHAVTGTLRGSIGDVAFSRTVTLPPHDSAYVRFTPDSFPQLRVANHRLWWPAELGEAFGGAPELYTLDVAFVAGGQVSDRQRIRFGIREITSELTPSGARLFRVNGKRVLIRGGGWAPDMFLRPQPERQDAQLRYALDMHLNTIRLEGNYEDDHRRATRGSDRTSAASHSSCILRPGISSRPRSAGVRPAMSNGSRARLRALLLRHPLYTSWVAIPTDGDRGRGV